jgi:hypothetical protein
MSDLRYSSLLRPLTRIPLALTLCFIYKDRIAKGKRKKKREKEEGEKKDRQQKTEERESSIALE